MAGCAGIMGQVRFTHFLLETQQTSAPMMLTHIQPFLWHSHDAGMHIRPVELRL